MLRRHEPQVGCYITGIGMCLYSFGAMENCRICGKIKGGDVRLHPKRISAHEYSLVAEAGSALYERISLGFHEARKVLLVVLDRFL